MSHPDSRSGDIGIHAWHGYDRSLVTIEKRIPEYAVTEDADETWETLPIEQLSSELERY